MLEVERLVVGYGKDAVLHEVDLAVPAGSTVSIIGANGAGKSTLLRTLSGLLRPRAGALRFEGRALPARPHEVVARGIIHVPEGRRVFAALSVHENLVMGGYREGSRSALQARMAEMYRLFPRLEERRAQLANTLSGGEQQMLAIARGLMANPKLLLLDEPSLGLAPLIIRQIFDIVRAVRERGVTVLMVEQNARQALAISDYSYVLQNGRIVHQGRAADLLHDPAIRQAYLGA